MINERDYWLWLTRIPGFSYVKIKILLAAHKHPKTLFELPKEEVAYLLRGKTFRSGDYESFMASRDYEGLKQYVKRLQQIGVAYVCIEDRHYPSKLLGLFEPAYVLYYRGAFLDHRLTIGMVGSRRCTAYGRKVAEKFAEGLVGHGVHVISGMATGIDTHSHLGALKGNGFTTAVLGSGINVCYPAENAELMKKIIRNGCVVSEYGLDIAPRAGLFPLRNRLISGLSDGLLLVEAKEKSGSLITVDCALDQGVDVFAIPGDVLGASNMGSNHVIRMGAKPAFDVSDILEEYSIYSKNRVNCSADIEKTLDESEKMVYSCISLTPAHLEDLARLTQMKLQTLQYIITKLELKGAIIQLPGKYFIKES